jgi:hypothetical protein
MTDYSFTAKRWLSGSIVFPPSNKEFWDAVNKISATKLKNSKQKQQLKKLSINAVKFQIEATKNINGSISYEGKKYQKILQKLQEKG